MGMEEVSLGFSILFSSIKTLADEEELAFWREGERGGIPWYIGSR